MQHYSFFTTEIEQINRHAQPLLGISQLPPMAETVDGKENLVSDAGVCVQEALTKTKRIKITYFKYVISLMTSNYPNREFLI
jgi:hypothetical protein